MWIYRIQDTPPQATAAQPTPEKDTTPETHETSNDKRTPEKPMKGYKSANA